MGSVDNENIIHGPNLLESIPNGSYGKTLYRGLQENYNLPIALVDAITRKSISYKTVIEQSLRLAYSLRNCGITQNDVIAISTENTLHCVLPVIAGLWLGATVTLYNPQYTTREILHVANISKPVVLFCTKTSLQPIMRIQKELPYLKKVIVIDGHVTEVKDVEAMEEFISKNTLGYKRFDPVDVDSHQVAIILYSSGTTGLPKGVMLTHYNFNAISVFFRDPRFIAQRNPGTYTTLGLLPFFHTYGFVIFIQNLLVGGSILVLPKFEKLAFLKAIQDFKLRSLSLVPSLANFLANSELVDKFDLSSIVSISSGAAPLSKHIEKLLMKRFKITHIRQGYGLTEATISAIISPTTGNQKIGSCGKLLPKTSAKVLDINTGKLLGPGKSGELYFKGPQIMKGYAGDIKSTNSVIDGDGWLKTGDIGYYDDEGYFYVVDRLKELIKYKGYQVPPAELEALLLEHPKILEAAVIGVPDDLAGEVPLAFVVKHSEQNLTEDDVKNFVAGQVAHYKQLRGGVRFIQEVPKSAAGKILRKELRQLLTQKSKL